MIGEETRRRHRLDEAWISQAEELGLDASSNGSGKSWVGASLPSIELPCFPGSTVNLAAAADLSSLILCVYSELDPVRAEAWSELTEELAREGFKTVALSSETPARQREWASTTKLAYPVVSDSELCLERHLDLPTVEAGEGARAYEDLTLVAHGAIVKVFYPLRHPGEDAATVMSWVMAGSRSTR